MEIMGIPQDLHTVTVSKSNGQGLGFRLAFADVGRNVPHPTAITANIWRELHVRSDWEGVSRQPVTVLIYNVP